MSVRSSFVAIAVAAGIVAVAVGTLAPRAVFAQATTFIEFAVPLSIPLTPTNPPTEPDDVLLVTGQPVGFTDGVGCVTSPGSYPVENMVAVDPGSGNRATRMANVLLILGPGVGNGPGFFGDGTTALKPGTRVVNITSLAICASNGIAYATYRGELQ